MNKKQEDFLVLINKAAKKKSENNKTTKETIEQGLSNIFILTVEQNTYARTTKFLTLKHKVKILKNKKKRKIK